MTKEDGNMVPKEHVLTSQERIDELFQEDANQVLSVLGSNPMCIVHAPYGYGKTTSLIPQIVSESEKRGKKGSQIKEGTSPHQYPSADSADIFIIDETGHCFEDNTIHPSIQDFLIDAAKVGKQVIPVLPHYPDQVPTSKIWQEIALRLYKTTVPEIRFPVRYLDPVLAKDFVLSKLSTISDRDKRERLLDFILKTMPYIVSVLDKVSTEAVYSQNDISGFFHNLFQSMSTGNIISMPIPRELRKETSLKISSYLTLVGEL